MHHQIMHGMYKLIPPYASWIDELPQNLILFFASTDEINDLTKAKEKK